MLFFNKSLRSIYWEYKWFKIKGSFKKPLVFKVFFESIPEAQQVYKNEILKMFRYAIANQDGFRLEFCIGAAFRDGIDAAYKPFVKEVILEKWHNQHEDLVDIISFHLHDDIFTDALYEIAVNPEYRKFDDELESTLRKCVHALKAINTINSNTAIERLVKSGNENVIIVLKMYE